MDRLLRKFRDMKREKLFLYFVVGIYLVYTAWSILRALVSGGAERPALLLVFGLVFAVFGLGLLLICGWALLRAYYLRLYLAELEEQGSISRLPAGITLPTWMKAFQRKPGTSIQRSAGTTGTP